MMGFDRIEAVSLTDQFVQKIEAMIISGELVPGDQLPPAREMSARMGVSRPVISAGLVELEKMGFVEIVTRQGVYVSDYRKSGSLDTLTALLNYNGGVMRDDEVRSLLEVRSANECLCVKLVVERATQEELDELRAMSKRINELMTELFAKGGVRLVDFKLEFGRTDEGLVLCDEISPDSCRLWDMETNKKLDKDRFRRDLGDVLGGYRDVLARLQSSI